MKRKKLQADDMTLTTIAERFPSDDKARSYLEGLRWPKGVVCPHCENGEKGTIGKIEANKEKKIRAGLYQCGKCRKQFTVTVGTIFEDSHVPLHKWLLAWYLMCSSKKGISALQIQRTLGLGSYRTAHFMTHRIRYALQDQIFTKKLGGTVEVDETMIGGVAKIDPALSAKERYQNKTRVFSMVERHGKKRSVVIDRQGGATLKSTIQENVAPQSSVVSDQTSQVKRIGRSYHLHTVKHSAGEYSRKVNDKFTAHINTVESSFALLKRGVYGVFHQISAKHLPLYLAEFDHRWNFRTVTDGQRTVEGMKKIVGKRLTYKKLRDG